MNVVVVNEHSKPLGEPGKASDIYLSFWKQIVLTSVAAREWRLIRDPCASLLRPSALGEMAPWDSELRLDVEVLFDRCVVWYGDVLEGGSGVPR